MKAEDAKRILEQVDEAGAGRLRGRLTIQKLDDENYSWTSGNDKTEILSKEKALKRLSGYKPETVGQWSFGEEMNASYDPAPERPNPPQANGGYTIWLVAEDGTESAIRYIKEGTRADAYVILDQEQESRNREVALNLRTGDESNQGRRPMVCLGKGGWKNKPVELMQKSEQYVG